MLYELFFTADGPRFDLPGIGLLRYISFRAVAAAVLAFALALFFGGRTIRWLRGASIGEDTGKTDSAQLAELHKGKIGTPTMGGIFLIGATLAAAAALCRFDGINRFTLPGLVLVAVYAAVGLADDWIKLRVAGKNGLSKRQKQGLLTAAAIGVALWVGAEGLGGEAGPQFHLPFVTEPLFSMGAFGFALLAVLVLTGTANAVNLTDGLDGLAIGCAITSTIAFAASCYFVGRSDFSEYLMVEHVPGAGELTVLLGALLGASFGFLWFNAPPAQVFMGDVGSLALGGTLGYAALVSRTEVILLVVGGVFVAEAVSVIVQVASFKTRGVRVFRCAPIHHHFQFGGTPETRIVVRAWLISALLALTSLLLFKIR
ncbi:MAG: phospho-N-acetylmuramoyl-pentapeptide-transferase [Planctomycetota bacterium]